MSEEIPDNIPLPSEEAMHKAAQIMEFADKIEAGEIDPESIPKDLNLKGLQDALKSSQTVKETKNIPEETKNEN